MVSETLLEPVVRHEQQLTSADGEKGNGIKQQKKKKGWLLIKKMKTVWKEEKQPVILGKASRTPWRTAPSGADKSDRSVFQLALVPRVIKVNVGRCISLKNIHLLDISRLRIYAWEVIKGVGEI